MNKLFCGGLARIVFDEDVRNIGKIVSLYEHHDKYNGYEDVWLFDCNEGVYINGCMKFTSIGTTANRLEVF